MGALGEALTKGLLDLLGSPCQIQAPMDGQSTALIEGSWGKAVVKGPLGLSGVSIDLISPVGPLTLSDDDHLGAALQQNAYRQQEVGCFSCFAGMLPTRSS